MIEIGRVDFSVLNMFARMPFRYGIAQLEAVPHLFLRLEARIGGASVVGLAADGLPPKWFTKDPDTSVSEDLEEMLCVIRNAAALALYRGHGFGAGESDGQAVQYLFLEKRLSDA